jgi:hypothetical protein
MLKAFVTALILLQIVVDANASAAHPCEQDAVQQAKKLLDLHVGPQTDTVDPVMVDPGVERLPPIRHPVYPKLKLDVLQLWASDSKGRFRMRFTYQRSAKTCSTLIAQEVMTYSVFSRHYGLD